MESNLAVSFQKTTTDLDSIWLHLEQENIPLYKESVVFSEVTEMLNRARSGLSAKTYKPVYCPITLEGAFIHIPLTFYVWPSDLALLYNLSCEWELSESELVSIPREGNIVIPMADKVEMNWLFDSISTTWDTPCYNKFGEVISNPTITNEKHFINLSAECFGVIRANLQAIGHKYICTISIEKINTVAVKNVKAKVLATYIDSKGETQKKELDLKIPQCALDFLEACPDGTWVRGGSITESDDEDRRIPVIYYSTCTGNVLLLTYE